MGQLTGHDTQGAEDANVTRSADVQAEAGQAQATDVQAVAGQAQTADSQAEAGQVQAAAGQVQAVDVQAQADGIREDLIAKQLRESLEDLQEQAHLGPGGLFVVGASTSEVAGKRIGTATSLAVGSVIAQEAIAFAESVGCEVAFQCCEHLNRALVVRKPLAKERGWLEVMARPVPGAGGAVAASAYLELEDACLVETIQADAGIDIGDTFIGMHLKRVAVPVRGRHREIGDAHVTLARTRPPLIGGSRAVYDEDVFRERLGLQG